MSKPFKLPATPAQIITTKKPWTHLGSTTYNTAFAAIATITGNVCTYDKNGNLLSGTEPVSDSASGVFIIDTGHAQVADLQFYGSADGHTFSARVWTMEYIESIDTTTGITTVQWFHRLVCATTTLTCGATPGVAGGILTASAFFVDTITLPSEERIGGPIGTIKDQPATPDNGLALLKSIDVRSAPKLKVELTRSGGTATSCGVLANFCGG